MLDQIAGAVETYETKWHKLIASRQDQAFFEGLKPVAVGWKVADEAEYKRAYDELHGQCDKTIETWMNGRWIAKLHLKDTKVGGMEIIKLMQRRPGSTDALGLDHLDFYSPAVTKAEETLKNEPDLKWSWESNDIIAGYDWISLWFDGTEAKLKSDTVLNTIIAELHAINQHITNV